jgi:hypothetical protein
MAKTEGSLRHDGGDPSIGHLSRKRWTLLDGEEHRHRGRRQPQTDEAAANGIAPPPGGERGQKHDRRRDDELDCQQGNGAGLRAFGRSEKEPPGDAMRSGDPNDRFFEISGSQLNMMDARREALRGRPPWRKIGEARKGDS